MTETTTKTTDAVDMTMPDLTATRGGEVATIPQTGSTALVPVAFDEFNLAVRRMLGLEDASEGEMQLFHHICQRSGLDPFAKEVYMIGRDTEVSVWVDSPDTGNRRQEKRRVTKYTIQVSIHGFRRRAREIAAALGVTYKTDQPVWCGDDGQWREVWPEKTAPTAAKFTVYRDGEPNTFVAHYTEFVQESGQGTSRGPNSMWSKMPRNQLRKCAEVGAIQMAYPDQLGGLVYDEAAQPTVIDGDVVVEQPRAPQRARGTSALEERAAAAAAAKAEQAADNDAQAAKPLSEENRRKWINKMFALMGEGKAPDREDQLIVIAGILGLDKLREHRDDMSDDELRTVATQLNDWKKVGTLENQVNELVNAWSLREAAEEDAAARDAEPAEQASLLDTGEQS